MDIAVITGASSGLGKVFAEKVCARYKDLDEISGRGSYHCTVGALRSFKQNGKSRPAGQSYK